MLPTGGVYTGLISPYYMKPITALKGRFSRSDIGTFVVALCVVVSLFGALFVHAAQSTATLTVSVAAALSFTTSTDVFGTITPGVAKFATTTLRVDTNNSAGWNVTLYGDSQGTSDTVLDLTTDAAVGITDQAEWIAGAATTSAGNAVRIASLDNSADVLAYRVMTASGTTPFRAATWWGAADAYTDSATTLWAGISSSTVQRQIGNAGAGSYSASTHISSVVYYLDVAATQQTGSYDGGLTYTATAN